LAASNYPLFLGFTYEPLTTSSALIHDKFEHRKAILTFMKGFLLVWFGWFGFNAGSELKSNMRAASAFMTTNIAAASGGFSYSLYQQLSGDKWTGVGFCTGAFTGLVSITPGAGYVSVFMHIVCCCEVNACHYSLERVQNPTLNFKS
jgi:ammonia channel protein AmtB